MTLEEKRPGRLTLVGGGILPGASSQEAVRKRPPTSWRVQKAQYGPATPVGEFWFWIPTNTLRPKKNGSPQSKPPPLLDPARLLNAALVLLKIVSALAMLNETCADVPLPPVLVAVKLVVEVGQ